MFDLTGVIFLTILFLVTLIISLHFKNFTKIILVALILRIFLLIINNNFFYLPDGNMDALNFEFWANIYSRDGFFNSLHFFRGPETYFLSFLISIPYSLFGRSMIMAQSFSIFIGIINILLVCLIARKLWNNQIAIKAGWLAALIPSSASYSVLVMREVYIAFFLLLAFLHIVNFFEHKNLKSFLFTSFSFVGATFFHGPSIFGFIVFLVILTFIFIKRFFNRIFFGKFNLNALGIIIVALIIFQYFFNIKNVHEYFDLERMRKTVINVKVKGHAAYPEWLKINSNAEFLYKAPIRSIYFVLSPFPWDVKKLSHLMGLFDSMFYILLSYLIFRNFKSIKKDQALKVILAILLFYFFIFGLAVGNFGTAIRHRVKFVYWMILLAAPLIPKLVLSKDKIIKVKNK